MSVWKEILEQLAQISPTLFSEVNAPATAPEIKTLEDATGLKLPASFCEYLSMLNGQINTEESKRDRNAEIPLFGYNNFLCITGILETWEMMNDLFSQMTAPIDWVTENKIKPLTWSRGWIPFSEYEGSTYLILDCDPGKNGSYGQVFLWHSGMDYEEIVADSFESFANGLLLRLKEQAYTINEFGIIDFADYYI